MRASVATPHVKKDLKVHFGWEVGMEAPGNQLLECSWSIHSRQSDEPELHRHLEVTMELPYDWPLQVGRAKGFMAAKGDETILPIPK